jgi:primosomal protein N' (replication factor Y)
VCGRAGRGEKKGRAIIQTYQPGHYVINLAKAHDYESFYKNEIRLRENFTNPPLCDIVMLTATGEDESKLKSALAESLKMMGGKMMAVPPAPAPISMLKGLSRWRTLIKCQATPEVRKKLCEIMDRFRGEKHFRIAVDVNPGSML